MTNDDNLPPDPPPSKLVGHNVKLETLLNISPENIGSKKGAFAALLAPLTKENFREIIQEVEENLKIVMHVFSLLDLHDIDTLLHEMLLALTLKTGELMGADRATVFLLDDDKDELWSVVAQHANDTPLEIRISVEQGIAGEVARTKKSVHIPYDFYDDPRSELAQEQEAKFGYRTYVMLAMPLLDSQGELLAVVQLLNKLKDPKDREGPIKDRIEKKGFTEEDFELFQQFALSIRLVLELSRSFYQVSQRQRAASALMEAIRSLSQSSLDLTETLKRVMGEAKKLMNADRATIWLVDREADALVANIVTSGEDGEETLTEARVPMGAGYVGSVAMDGQKINVPFDLYNDPRSDNSKKFDKDTEYRTCSLLCMPIRNTDNEIIAVTQLINKRRQGDFPEYDPNDWPEAPERFKSSFQSIDEIFMESFNVQAGVAIRNAKLFATVQQQAQMQRNILASLSNAVFSTDREGVITTANESAHKLLGAGSSDDLKGLKITDVIRLEEGNFEQWFDLALHPTEEEHEQQYYPDQILKGLDEAEHNVDLSLNPVVDVSDQTRARGALVVLDDISDEKRLKTTMYRYMSQELAEELLKLDNAHLGGDRKKVSVLFSDIRGYTSLTEKLRPEEVVTMLNEYFELMVETIFENKGTLDKFIGDAIMAVFGSPLPLEEHEWMSVQTAVAMRNRLAEYNQLRKKQNLKPLRIGIGINSDEVIGGHIGSSKRMEFTVIGDGVNLASRLEGTTKLYGCDIIISEQTYSACADKLHVREVDFVKVKGRSEPVGIYEVIAIRDGELARPLTSKKQKIIDLYRGAREHYLKCQFERAIEEFNRVLEIEKNDKPSLEYVKRCRHWMENPPHSGWDGSWELTEK